MNSKEAVSIKGKLLKDIDIFLFSNGQEQTPPTKYHLCSETLTSWEHVVDSLRSRHLGNTHHTLRLYTPDGQQIHGPLELVDGMAYVAVPSDEEFLDSGYGSYLVKANRSREKRQAKASSTEFELVLLQPGCHPCCSCQKYSKIPTNANEKVRSFDSTVPETPELEVTSALPSVSNQYRDLIESALSAHKGLKTTGGEPIIVIIGDKNHKPSVIDHQQRKTTVDDRLQRRQNSMNIENDPHPHRNISNFDNVLQRNSTTADGNDHFQLNNTAVENQPQQQQNSTAVDDLHQIQMNNTTVHNLQPQKQNRTSTEDQLLSDKNIDDPGHKNSLPSESQHQIQQIIKPVDDQPQRKRNIVVTDDRYQLQRNKVLAIARRQQELNNTNFETKQLPKFRKRAPPPTFPLKKSNSQNLDNSNPTSDKAKILVTSNIKSTIQTKIKPSSRFPLKRRDLLMKTSHNDPTSTIFNIATDSKISPPSRQEINTIIETLQNNTTEVKLTEKNTSDINTPEAAVVCPEQNIRISKDEISPISFRTVSTSTHDNIGQTQNISQTPVLNYVDKEVQINVQLSSKDIQACDPTAIENMVTAESDTGNNVPTTQVMEGERSNATNKNVIAVVDKGDFINIKLNILIRKPDVKPVQINNDADGAVDETSLASIHSLIETEFINTYSISEKSKKVALVREQCVCQYHDRNSPHHLRYVEHTNEATVTKKNSSGFVLKKIKQSTSLETLKSTIQPYKPQNNEVKFWEDIIPVPVLSKIVRELRQSNEMEYSVPRIASTSSVGTELLVVPHEQVISTHLYKLSVDKTTETDWCNVLLEAHYHDDGRYTFHLPPLKDVHSLLTDGTMETKPKD